MKLLPAFTAFSQIGKSGPKLIPSQGRASSVPNLMFRGKGYLPAMQEHLGLKLESVKAPVEVFVIDHAERPEEN